MPSVVRRIWRWTAAGIGVILIVLAMGVGMFRLFLPQLPEYRAQIEQWATQALGRPLRIGSIDARLSLQGPRIVFRDTVVLAADGVTPVVDADSISVVISVMDLLLEQRLAVSSVRIEGVVLEVERLKDGRFAFLNREFPVRPGTGASLEGAARSEIPDGRYEIRDATIRLTNAARPGEVLVFQRASLDVYKNGNEFNLGVKITPPPSLGQDIRITANTNDLDKPGEQQKWQLVVQADAIDLTGWKDFVPAKIPAPDAGRGSITVWASAGSQGLDNAIVDLNLNGLSLPTTNSGRAAVFQKLAGKLELVKKPGDWQFKMRDLSVERDGRAWQSVSVSVEVRPDTTEGQLFYIAADQIQLDDIQPFLPWVPDETLRQRLEDLAPRGVLSDLNVQFVKHADGHPSYSMRAKLAGVGVNAVGKLPGASGLSGDFKATDDGGLLELASPGLLVDLPTVFEKPLQFDQAEGRIGWRQTAAGMSFSGTQVVLANADIHTVSKLNLVVPTDGGAPVIDLETQIKDGNVAAKTPYLPIVKLSPKVREWLDRSLISGRIPQGRMILRGPLDKFPFSGGEGQFKVEFALRDLSLDYQRDWPSLSGVNADVRFEGPGLYVDLLGGDLAGNTIEQGTAEIPRLAGGRLTVKARTSGPVNAGLSYLAAIPPGERYRDAIAGLETSGQAQVDLDLYLPLKRVTSNRLKLDIKISDAAVRPKGLERGLEQINGELRLEDGGLYGQGITANYLGKPTRVEVSPDPSDEKIKATLMLLRGWSDAGELMGQFFPLIRPWVSGKTDWFAVARFPAAQTGEPVTVSARSVLGGMSINLPRPMLKKAEDVRMLELLYTFNSEDRRTLELALGDDVRANLVFKPRQDHWDLDFGDIALGGKVPDREAQPGLGISGHTAVLEVNKWLALTGQAPGDEHTPGLKDILQRVDLQVDEFTVVGQREGAATLRLRNTGTDWVATVNSDNIVGTVTVPQDPAGELPARVDMEKLLLVGGLDASDSAASEDAGTDPRSLRPYEIHVADFGLADMRFGSLEAKVSRAPMGLSLDMFKTQHKAFHAEGVGSWLVTDDGEMTGLKFKVTGTDILEMFKALGLGQTISGRSLTADVDVYWRGGPDSKPMESLSGQVRLQLENGTMAEIEPGAGRALGLLSVTALPRRLTLDFRDVFDQGLAFDRISGDFNIVDGNAYTSNLVMKGPSVGISISGRTGLADHSYDQVAVVHANIGSSLPLAGALAGGPTLGAALLIFSEVFKGQLQGMTRARYKVTGSWENPKVERLELTPAVAPKPQPKPVPDEAGQGPATEIEPGSPPADGTDGTGTGGRAKPASGPGVGARGTP